MLRVARESGLVEIGVVNLRTSRRPPIARSTTIPMAVDRGMTLKVEPVFRALEAPSAPLGDRRERWYLLTPQGERCGQSLVVRPPLYESRDVVMIMGAYKVWMSVSLIGGHVRSH